MGEDTDPRAELASRCDAIEASYELMLAYASRGLSGEHGSEAGKQIREHLRRFDRALVGLAQVVHRFVGQLNLEPAADYRAFVDLLDRDAHAAQTALRLVLAQGLLTSQIVDNLNASLHIRTLLTDLFLIDEVLKTQAPDASGTPR